MKKTLVLGASLNPSRYSNYVIHRLVESGHPVAAFGLREGVVAGIPVSNEKKELTDIHTITLYIGAKHQPEYYDYILSLNPERVIFNPGTENPELYQILKENGISFEASCNLVLLSTNQY